MTEHPPGTSREGSQTRPENQGDGSPDATARPAEPIPVNRKLDSRGVGDTAKHTGPVEDDQAEPRPDGRRARK